MYDKTKMANIGNRRNVYNSNIDITSYPTDVIDYIPDSPNGGIYLPPDESYHIHALSSRHPPPLRPGNPSNHHSSLILNNQDPKSPLKGMMALSTSSFKLLSQDAMKA